MARYLAILVCAAVFGLGCFASSAELVRADIPKDSQSAADEWHETQAAKLLLAPWIKLNFFPVTGTTVEELKLSLRKQGPVDQRSSGYFAYTKWWVRWSKVSEPFRVECEAILQLPFCSTCSTGSAALQAKWRSFFEALIRHERRHLENAVNGCRKLGITLQSLIDPAERREAGQLILEQMRMADEAIDRETDHGRKEGAEL